MENHIGKLLLCTSSYGFVFTCSSPTAITSIKKGEFILGITPPKGKTALEGFDYFFCLETQTNVYLGSHVIKQFFSPPVDSSFTLNLVEEINKQNLLDYEDTQR